MRNKLKKELEKLGVESTEELNTVCKNYFAQKDKIDEPYSLLELARKLNLERKEILFYPFEKEIDFVLKNARTSVEASLENELIRNPKNANAIIFLLKVNFGWGEEDIKESDESTINIEFKE